MFRTVDAVGDAWSWLILREAIFDRVCRFEDFRARLAIARSTLSGRLEQLTSAGLFERHSSPAIGVEYRLAPPGEDFLGCLMTAMRWGDHWAGTDADPPVRAVHRECGQVMTAVLACSRCGGRLEAREVGFDSRPEPVTCSSGAGARQRAPGLELLERVRPCSIARTLQVVGDRWSALIIQECFFGAHRFDDFARQLSIAPNILSQRLNRLVEHAVLTRTPYQDNPVRHEYRLTASGFDLYPVPLAMLTWGDRWLSHGRPPVVLTHLACDHQFTAQLVCSACAGPLGNADIDLTPRRHP
ncbi:helix-turn-helix domain-containing protein [Nocardia sp. NPDC050435]|uniref:winged helix-turn-helix transcriptional regulator n=1 Tax=Nocardia sp. NPDC050435 TaxID=3155040 RepID=UPI0033ECDF45